MIPKQIPLSQLKSLRSSPPRMGGAAFVNQTVSIGDTPYQNAIIMRPGSDVVYDIKGLYNLFSAMVEIGDDSNSDSDVEFIIIGDEKELWRSTAMKKADGVKSVNVDIRGNQHLVLRVSGQVLRVSRIQAAWINATLNQ